MTLTKDQRLVLKVSFEFWERWRYAPTIHEIASGAELPLKRLQVVRKQLQARNLLVCFTEERRGYGLTSKALKVERLLTETL